METVCLTAHGATAVINLRGAELTSYVSADGREYIWQGDPDVWAEHAPILFPVCGRARNDQVIVEGTAYPMPKHGFACKCDFSTHQTGEDFVDLVLEGNDDTKVMYPFDFALHVIYTIGDCWIRTAFVVENRTERSMPFCLGGHPGLNIPFSDEPGKQTRLVFDSPVSNKLDIVITGGYIDGKESLHELENGVTLPLTHQVIDERDTLLFGGIACASATLIPPDGTDGVALDFKGFPNLAVWSMKGKNAPYVCLEPWIGLPASPAETGVLSEKPDAITLPAHGRFEAAFTVRKA